MRITPIGLAFRNASDAQLYEAARLAVLSTHVHPNAVVRSLTLPLSFNSEFLTLLRTELLSL